MQQHMSERTLIPWKFICYLFMFSLLYVSDIYQNCQSIRIQSHWLKLFDFLHSAFSNMPSNGLPEEMHNHTDYTCLTFLLDVFSNCILEWMLSHTGCIYVTFLTVRFQTCLHRKLSLSHISIYMRAKLLIFSLIILRFCLIYIKQMLNKS